MNKWKTWIACAALFTMLPLQANAVKVVIDAGHGGYDRGATGVNGLYEKEVNLDISLRLEEELSKRGYETVLTRKSDYYLSLQQRVDIASSSNADLFVSVHANSYHSPEISGSLVLYYDQNYPQVRYPASVAMKELTPESRKLAQYVLNNVVQQGNTVNRGLVPSSVYVIRRGEIPSILIETAFLSNSHDAGLLRQSDFRQKMAVGIANGIESFFPSLFNDIHNHWAQESILRLAEDGFVEGSNHQFLPNRSMTRAEFLVMMDRIFGFSARLAQAGEVTILSSANAQSAVQYPDLNPEHWAFRVIEAAAKLGFIAGYNDGTIRPNEPITRAEMSVLLNRFIQERNPDSPIEEPEATIEGTETPIVEAPVEIKPIRPAFSDVLQGTWAYDAISDLWQLGVVYGISQGRFAPYRNITRAEGAVMIDRFLQLTNHDQTAESPKINELPMTPEATENEESTGMPETIVVPEISEIPEEMTEASETTEILETVEIPVTTGSPDVAER